LYELLATIFRAPLTADSLRRLRSEEFVDALEAAGMSLDDEFRLGDEEALLDTLAVDFTQLFHGPREHRVANESVQTGDGEGTLDGDANLAVQAFYRSAGLSYDKTEAELSDHISVELAAMAALARAEAEALEGRWGIDLGNWVALRARTPFNREAGNLLAEFLQADAAELTRRVGGSARPENHFNIQ
jgi:TorA maturation chaperone TorD